MIKLGPTGDYPLGKHRADDEGGLQLAITVRGKVVEIHFGKEVAWIGLDKTTALQFAEAIKRRAESIKD